MHYSGFWSNKYRIVTAVEEFLRRCKGKQRGSGAALGLYNVYLAFIGEEGPSVVARERLKSNRFYQENDSGPPPDVGWSYFG